MESYIGEIIMAGFDYAPRNYALCDGQLLAIYQNQSLFSLLGTTFKGDGRATFGLPDLRGRIPLHFNNGIKNYWMGSMLGANEVVVNTKQIPSHTHSISLSGGLTVGGAKGASITASGNFLGSQGSASANDLAYRTSKGKRKIAGLRGVTFAVANTGQSKKMSIVNPYLTISFCITLDGLFPSRN